ncbi:MAG TPA: hypothetical protein VK448_06770 [Dissulfurispiraceae bacterium]|nr:hypothetical protein [Dissulfurispiraceae bacterium]
MKTVNIIIFALAASLIFFSYQLATRFFQKPETSTPEKAPAAVVQKAKPASDQAVRQKTQRDVAAPAAPAPAPLPVARQEVRVAQQPAPAPVPVKEEPKLRPVRDIKVVMYMTDW